MVIRGKVYDVQEFRLRAPCGSDVFVRYAGEYGVIEDARVNVPSGPSVALEPVVASVVFDTFEKHLMQSLGCSAKCMYDRSIIYDNLGDPQNVVRMNWAVCVWDVV